MKYSIYKKIRFFFYIFSIIICSYGFLKAENNEDLGKVIERINSVEEELKSLQNTEIGSESKTDTSLNLSNSIANHEKRLVDMEEEIRSLNGLIEEMSFKLDRLFQQANTERTYEKNQFEENQNSRATVVQEEVVEEEETNNTIVLEDPNVKNNPTMKVLGTVPQSNSTTDSTKDEVATNKTIISKNADQPKYTEKQTKLSDDQLTLLSKSPSEIYKYAYDMLVRENFTEAEKSFKAFIGEHPNDTLTSNAYYWLGETYYVQKKFQLAAISFARGFQSFPKGNKAIDQLFKLALTFINLGKNEDACAAFSKLEAEFPNAPKRISNRAKEYMKRAKC